METYQDFAARVYQQLTGSGCETETFDYSVEQAGELLESTDSVTFTRLPCSPVGGVQKSYNGVDAAAKLDALDDTYTLEAVTLSTEAASNDWREIEMQYWKDDLYMGMFRFRTR